MNHPEPPSDALLEALLLDAEREGPKSEAAARLASLYREDPAAAARLERLARFHARVRGAHHVTVDADVAAGLSARIRERVGAEEERARRESGAGTPPARVLWARILGISLAAHVVLLALLVVKVRRDERAETPARVTIALPEGYGPRDLASTDPGAPSPWLPGPGEAPMPPLPVDPRLRPVEEEARELAALEGLAEHRFEHPPGVLAPMRARLDEGRKRARLRRAGLDADLTLATVSRGLRALSTRQRDDGSWPAATAPGRDVLTETALALLPFLGDGHASRQGTYGPRVVAPGIAWIRGRLFDDRGAAREVEAAEAPALGIALKALAEDYMLSYGRLGPVEARRRGAEIAALAGRLAASQAPDGSFPGAERDLQDAIWPMWGLDAAARTGAVLPPAEVSERFAAWFGVHDREGPEDDAAGLLLARHLGREVDARVGARAARVAAKGWEAEATPFLVATTSSGLLRQDPAAYRVWSEGMDQRLARRLLPTGIVREGDPVGDTALVLLALQTAYRTY